MSERLTVAAHEANVRAFGVEAARIIAALADRAEKAEADAERLAEALRPFALYHRWRKAKGMKVGLPGVGPKQMAEASDVLAAHEEQGA